MRKSFRLSTAIALLAWLSGGCVTAPEREAEQPPPSDIEGVGRVERQMIVWVPLTDADAPAWLELLERHPRLRLVIAMSPGFSRFAKDAELRERILDALRSGRLELALQLANPPLLPLLIDTQAARLSLPASAPLPEPPYRNPDDVIQQIARAKAGYYKIWKSLPRGFVVPHGAVSPELVRQLERLGFSWVVAALGNAQGEAAFRSGPTVLWDGAPESSKMHTLVRVWDDRTMGDGAGGRARLEAWAAEIGKRGDVEAILPSDFAIPAAPLPDPSTWRRRTWMSPDWSPWIGSPAKNAAWVWLGRARAALETFKNSGQATVRRLDLAMGELFTAQSASYFQMIGNPAVSAATAEDHEREFKASLASVFKMMGQSPPDDLFSPSAMLPRADESRSPVLAERGARGEERVVISDAAGDERAAPSPAYDLRGAALQVGSSSLDLTVTLGAPGDALVDVYADLNQTPGAGTTSLLEGRGLHAAAEDAWEYAVAISSEQASLFRTRAGGSYEWTASFSLHVAGATRRVSIPRTVMRGNPSRWGYQVLTMQPDPHPGAREARPRQPEQLPALSSPVFDIVDPPDVLSSALFSDIASGIRSELPFVRAASAPR